MNAPQGLSIPAGTMILVDPHAPAIDGKLVIAQLEEGQTPRLNSLLLMEVKGFYVRSIRCIRQSL